MPPPKAVVTDIEGTTTRISFVHDVLFPYARARLPGFLASNASHPEVQAALAEVTRLAPGADPLAALLGWMDEDAKITPLKSLQGQIWNEGYATGALQSDLYPDVPAALRRWHAAGTKLYVYSSGSVAAQKLLFAHSPAGDLTPLFHGHFDTRIGAKRDAASYHAIAATIGLAPTEILFLSDVAAELDAAAAAGMRVCQVLRPQDGTQASGHPNATDFNAVETLFSLSN
jgi:enolase-phosphatase E1